MSTRLSSVVTIIHLILVFQPLQVVHLWLFDPTPAAAFSHLSLPSSRLKTASRARQHGLRIQRAALRQRGSNDDDDNDISSSFFDLSELQSRIANLQRVEQQQEDGKDQVQLELPVLAWDALLPCQRLRGSTSDPTLARLLRDVGIGGRFVMISLHSRERKLRRDGVVCKIEAVDARQQKKPHQQQPGNEPSHTSTPMGIPTAVDFSIVGLEPCRVEGASTDLLLRVGRWRRGYDPDGEETRLGWGVERFVDADPIAATSKRNDAYNSTRSTKGMLSVEESAKSTTEWSWTRVLVKDALENNQRGEDHNHDAETVALAQRIPPLLEQWETLAGNERTYDNTQVVVTARLRRGHAGLWVQPAALLRKVRAELGPLPDHDPTRLALYGAALINPLPPLGVAPEIRGRILSATTAKQRLQILEWAVQRSIRNLEGTQPL